MSVIIGDAIIAGQQREGVVSKVLNNNSWATIKTVADASQGANYWAVGDRKQVHLSGTAGDVTWNNDYWVYIIGFDHNSAKEGIGIAFQGFKTAQTGGADVALVGANYALTGTTGFIINKSNTNVGGWNGSYAYTTIMPQIKAILPTDLQAVIRTTTLYTDNTGGGGNNPSAATVNANEVYYLAEYEVFGANAYANPNEPSQQTQYAYYAAGNSKVKYRSDNIGTAATWVLRSPYRSNNASFCDVVTDGSAYVSYAYRSYGSAPCFKV